MNTNTEILYRWDVESGTDFDITLFPQNVQDVFCNVVDSEDFEYDSYESLNVLCDAMEEIGYCLNYYLTADITRLYPLANNPMLLVDNNAECSLTEFLNVNADIEEELYNDIIALEVGQTI